MKRPTGSLAVTAALFGMIAASLAAIAAPGSKGGIARPGRVKMTAKSSSASPGAIVYTSAHMVTDTGATLDADELRAVLDRRTNQLQKAVATGNVKAFVKQPEENRQYTVYASKAVFDPKTNVIELSGPVKEVIESPYTEGPLVQTGTAGTVHLGKGPEFPVISMESPSVEFTPKQ